MCKIGVVLWAGLGETGDGLFQLIEVGVQLYPAVELFFSVHLGGELSELAAARRSWFLVLGSWFLISHLAVGRWIL